MSRVSLTATASYLPERVMTAAEVAQHSGIPEAVVDGETGLLSAEGDRVGLAANLSRLLGDERLRDRLGQQARALMTARFDLTKQTARLEDIYDEVAAAHPAR